MKASIEVQKAVHDKCLELPLHSIKNLATTQLKDSDPRKEVYQAFLDGWKFDESLIEEVTEDTEPQLVTKPSDEYVARKYIQILENAERRTKEFDLTLAEVKRLMSIKRCEYTGVPLYIQRPNCQEKLPHGRTFDRLDPNKGYVRGNVFAVTHVANSIKNVLFEDHTSCIASTLKEMAAMTSNLTKLGFSMEEV